MTRIRTFLVLIGIGLLAFAAYASFDSFQKLGWPEAVGTALSVDTKCEMKSEERNILTKTTYEATIDCTDVDNFKVMHVDQKWNVRQFYLVHMTVSGAVPTTTSMAVYTEPAPRPGQMRLLIQDPQDPKRVLGREASRSGFTFAGIMAGIGALMLALAWLLRGRRDYYGDASPKRSRRRAA